MVSSKTCLVDDTKDILEIPGISFNSFARVFSSFSLMSFVFINTEL